MKNEVVIKSVYLISSEFGLKSGKSMVKILISGAQTRKGIDIFSLKSLIGKGGRGCNSLKWLAFSIYQLIGEVLVIVGGGS